MICDRCGKNRANSYKKITENGKEKFLHLCPDCSKSIGLSGFKNLSIGQKMEHDKTTIQKQARVCPVCFSSFNSIVKNGKFGCSKCYEIFAEEFKNSILNVQDGKIHVGKRGKL